MRTIMHTGLDAFYAGAAMLYRPALRDVPLAVSLKAGGCGTRCTCRILDRETYLFDDQGRWYVEAR